MSNPNILKFKTSQQNWKANYEQESRLSNSTSFLSRIRRLSNKKVILDIDLKDLADLIEKQHLSIFGSLNHFFIKLRNQLVLSFSFYQQIKGSSPHFKEKEFKFSQIPFSKYFDKSLCFKPEVFSQLYESFRKKFLFYKNNPISPLIIDQQSSYLQTSQKLIHESFDEKVIEQTFPQAYSFFKELEFFLNYFGVRLLPDDAFIKNLPNQQKQVFVYSVIEQEYLSRNQPNTSFQKPQNLLDRSIKLQDHEFYEIESFIEKMKLEAKLISKKSPFLNHVRTQFQSVPIKCIGCASIFYQSQPIFRDRSSITNFQVVKSVKDSKNYARLKQLIEGFMNSPNGGVILFDCDDYLFETYPRGYETNLKNFEFRRQSIIDVCKNYYKDFQIDRDFTIDFVILHDKDENPIIKKTETEEGLVTTEFFVTRLKVFGRKVTSELKTNDDIQSKKNLKDEKIIAFEVQNNQLSPIDYEEMKMRFYKNENILKMIDKPEIYQKIEKAFYKNNNKMSQLLKGRISPFHLHESQGCKSTQMVTINKKY